MYRWLIVAATLALAAVAAEAQEGDPFLTGTFIIDVYNGNGGGSLDDAKVQALKSNPLITGEPLSTVTYQGPLNFTLQLPQSTPSTIKNFFDASLAIGGSYSGLNESTGALNLSSPPFADTTVLVIKFAKGSIVNGSIVHDDGIGLYVNNSLVTPTAAARPASVVTTPFTTVAGNYELIYVAANGNPSILRVSAPPPNPDFVDFGCRIDLTQTSVPASFKQVVSSTTSEKFCPATNNGTLALVCSRQIDGLSAAEDVTTPSTVCKISGLQCGLSGVKLADRTSISIDQNSIVTLNCEWDAP